MYSRENVLVSYEYKATPNYFTSEIRIIVAKFGIDDRLITNEDVFDFEDKNHMDGVTPGGE